VDRLFLDANILFSAAYSSDSPLLELWKLKKVLLFSSAYALEEARRNLTLLRPDSSGNLQRLTAKVHLVDAPPLATSPIEARALHQKDLPILLAAIEARATHLLTADKKHFRSLRGKTVEGVLVLTPGDYLRTKRESRRH
jgi:predicted nucleic acid-binding protein